MPMLRGGLVGGSVVCDAEEAFTDFTLEAFANRVPLLGVFLQITIVDKVV